MKIINKISNGIKYLLRKRLAKKYGEYHEELITAFLNSAFKAMKKQDAAKVNEMVSDIKELSVQITKVLQTHAPLIVKIVEDTAKDYDGTKADKKKKQFIDMILNQ